MQVAKARASALCWLALAAVLWAMALRNVDHVVAIGFVAYVVIALGTGAWGAWDAVSRTWQRVVFPLTLSASYVLVFAAAPADGDLRILLTFATGTAAASLLAFAIARRKAGRPS